MITSEGTPAGSKLSPLSNAGYWDAGGDNSSKFGATNNFEAGGADADDLSREITPAILRGWLRRASRKLRTGIPVLRVTSNGKLVRRTVFLGAKPEYFEITSAKPFDFGYHVTDVQNITLGCKSHDFETFIQENAERLPNEAKSCVLEVDGREISLVFKSESDRRDFMFLLRVERAAAQKRHAFSTEVQPLAGV